MEKSDLCIDTPSHYRQPSNVSDTSFSSTSSNSPDSHLDLSPLQYDPVLIGAAGAEWHKPYRSDSISSVATSPEILGADSFVDRRCRSRASSIVAPYSLHHRNTSVDSFASFSDSEWGQQTSSELAYPAFDLPVLESDQFDDALARRASDASISNRFENMIIHPVDPVREKALEEVAQSIQNATSTAASDKARAVFVQKWLKHTYTVSNDSNVSRHAFYGSYSRCCERFGIRSINTASFGKVVRTVFPQVKTRRLGVRGNSKYHYCGIRPINAEEEATLAELNLADPDSNAVLGGPGEHAGLDSDKVALPLNFPTIAELVTSDVRFAREDWSLVWQQYTSFCTSLIQSARQSEYDQIMPIIQAYYAADNWSADHRVIVEDPSISTAMFRADSIIFDAVIGFILQRGLANFDMASFTILQSLSEQIETFFVGSTEHFSHAFTSPKVELIARFGHLIQRLLGVCQLSQALRDVFSNEETMQNMLHGWDDINFDAILNHCALATNCQQEQVLHCFQEFRKLLLSGNQCSPAQLIIWLDGMMHNFLTPDLQGEQTMLPRSLLVKSNFVISQLIRDLTIRSDKSFGSFQLLALFCEDWIGLSVLRQIALPPAAVSASVESLQSHHSPLDHSNSPQVQHLSPSQLNLILPANSSSPVADQLQQLHNTSRALLESAKDADVNFSCHTSAIFDEGQYATFGVVSPKRLSLLTPLASQYGHTPASASDHTRGDLTAKDHTTFQLDFAPFVPQTPLSPSFLFHL